MEDNVEKFFQEAQTSKSILQRNRHRSVAPYEWFGPDPEPNPSGDSCRCIGCQVRRASGGVENN